MVGGKCPLLPIHMKRLITKEFTSEYPEQFGMESHYEVRISGTPMLRPQHRIMATWTL